MPLYEYKCDECGRIKEAIQKFSDAPLQKCSDCSGKLHKMISNSAFHLKGEGWYATDYGASSKKASLSNQNNLEGKAEKNEAVSKKTSKESG